MTECIDGSRTHKAVFITEIGMDSGVRHVGVFIPMLFQRLEM